VSPPIFSPEYLLQESGGVGCEDVVFSHVSFRENQVSRLIIQFTTVVL
jgi:hypothetical protein